MKEPIRVNISEPFQDKIQYYYKRIDEPVLLSIAGEIFYSSIQENFEVGGRPAWKPLKEKTSNDRTASGHFFEDDSGRSMQVLVRSGDLRNSVFYKVERDTLYLGENKVYAPVHHFGAKKGEFGTFSMNVKAHTRERNGKKYNVRSHTRNQSLPWGDIPARQSLVIQSEDWDVVLESIEDFILWGK